MKDSRPTVNVDVYFGPRVTEGRTAEIYEWGFDGTQIIKVLKSGYDPGDLYTEAANTKIAAAAGLPVPHVFQTVDVHGRPGVVYEWVHGLPMSSNIRPHTILKYGRMMAELHAHVHRCAVPGMRSQRDWLNHQLNELADDNRASARKVLDDLPDGIALCHMDMHPRNILLTMRGPKIIDWNNAVRGDPDADVARTKALLQVVPASDNIPPWIFRLAVSILRWAYMRRYRQLRPEVDVALARWEFVMAWILLGENIAGTHERLLNLIDRLRKQIGV